MFGSRAWHAGIHVKSDFENHAGASRLATSYFEEKKITVLQSTVFLIKPALLLI